MRADANTGKINVSTNRGARRMPVRRGIAGPGPRCFNARVLRSRRLDKGVLVACVALVALFVARGARADGVPTLSGRWSATAMRVAWNIGDWGAACGPRPGGGGAPGGTATVSQNGGELTISGAGRSYSTTQCWEQFPGLNRTSHSGGTRGWRNVCKTAANDPRQATIITTISATDSTISFDETGQYQFVINGQNCTASVRRNRSFKLIQREGEAPPAPASAAPPAATSAAPPPPKPKPEPAPARCAETGPPARLEVRPSRKLMRPGDEFTFRAAVLDAKGCALGVAPTWRIATEHAPAKLLGPGRIRIADDAGESELTLSAVVAGRAANVVVEIASKDRYEALLRQGGFNDSGESEDAAVAVIASGSIGARSSVAGDEARGRKRTFIAVLGSAALVLGLIGLVLVLRGRKRRPPGPMPGDDAETAGPPAPASAHKATVCPTCREEYPPDAQFCAIDGNRLVPLEDDASRSPTGGVCPVCGQGFDPGVQACPKHDEELVPVAIYRDNQRSAATGKTICPVCGTQYPGDSRFCGTDGAALLPLN